MPNFTASTLHDVATALFRAAGAEPEPTGILVDHLIAANLAGHDSHGMQQVPNYLRQIKSGGIQPNARPMPLKETPVSTLLDGAWAFGQVAAHRATEIAIEKAKSQGLAAVGIVRCNHVGRVGTYAAMAAAEDVFAMVTLGDTSSIAVPFGGRKGLFGTNPFAFGFPAGRHGDLLVDFATTTVAAGKIAVARAKHEPAPEGSLVDKDGSPTTDPNALFEGGALLPFAGHKGYGLAVVALLLGRALTGALDHAPDGRLSNAFVLAIDAGIFRSADAVKAEVDDIFGAIKAVPPASGVDRVLVPGEPERLTTERRRAQGIFLPDDTWAEIGAVAAELGVAI